MGEVCQVDKELLLLLLNSGNAFSYYKLWVCGDLEKEDFWNFSVVHSLQRRWYWCWSRDKHKTSRFFEREISIGGCFVKILCEIFVDTLVYQCVKLLWVFPGVGGLVRRTGGAPDKPSKEPPGGRPGFTAGKEGQSRRRGSAQGRAEFIAEESREKPGA